MRTINQLTNEQKKALVGQILNRNETGNEWAEIVNMFSLDMHEDTLRKMAPGVKLAMEALAGDDVSDGYIERQKLRDLNAQVRTEFRKESRSELLRQTVREAVRSMEPLPKIDRKRNKSSGDKELVVCIGDTHFGADINCKGLYGESINRYNKSQFAYRMDVLLEQIEAILAKENIDTVRLYMVGDLIDGILRQSQLTRLEFGLVQQVIQFSEYMAKWIHRLSGAANVNVVGVSGNHSEIRPLGSKAREFEEENLEKIIYWYLKSRFECNDQVTIRQVCDRMQIDDVCGYTFLLLHGDGQKKIEDLASSAVNLYGHKIDFFVCGHLHRRSEFPTGVTSDGNSEIIRVPSVCGMDLYAQNKGYGGKAGAVALVIEQKYGCRCKYPIRLDR